MRQPLSTPLPQQIKHLSQALQFFTNIIQPRGLGRQVGDMGSEGLIRLSGTAGVTRHPLTIIRLQGNASQGDARVCFGAQEGDLGGYSRMPQLIPISKHGGFSSADHKKLSQTESFAAPCTSY